MYDFGKEITNIFCEQLKDKINENESLDKYINNLSKEELERLLKINAIIEDDNKLLLKIANKNKPDIIQLFKDSIKDIYKNIIKNSTSAIIDQMNSLIKEYKEKVLKLDLSNNNYSLNFLEFLKTSNIGRLNYNKDEFTLIIFIPKELLKIIEEIIKDKSIKKEVKHNTEIVTNINCLMSTYGVVPINELNKLYNRTFTDINEDEILNRIIINRIFNEDLGLASSEEGYLVFNPNFNEKEAINFYRSLSKDINYKIYTPNEYKEINQGAYHFNIDEYDELYDFLSEKMYMNEDEIYEFDEMFLLDYLFSYQTDPSTAKKNLKNNLERVFNKIDIKVELEISRLLLAIARNYPNYKYKGHTYNEIKGDK